MSDKQKAALDALAELPQDRRDQVLSSMDFLAMGYQMGLDDAKKEAEENGQKKAD